MLEQFSGILANLLVFLQEIYLLKYRFISCNHQATNLIQILQYKINFKKIVKIIRVYAINILSVRFYLKIVDLLVEKKHISLFFVSLQYFLFIYLFVSSAKALIENEKHTHEKVYSHALLVPERQRRAVRFSQTIHSKQINKASNILNNEICKSEVMSEQTHW